jgi:ABC-type lipoprotein export system ATPase subunit
MSEIQRETGTTFLLSTHDRELADRCGRRIYMRGGVVVAQARETAPALRVIDKTIPIGRKASDDDRLMA